MVKRDANPMRLVWLAIAGALLVASTLFLIFAPIPRVIHTGCSVDSWIWANRLRIFAFLGPGLPCLTLSLWAETRFTRGFRNDRWSESDLARIGSLLAHPVWKIIGIALILLWFGGLILSNQLSQVVFISALFMPLSTVSRMQRLTTQGVRKNSNLVNWRNFQPIHSEHWGEPRS